jgi:hypothetical protein
MMISATPLQTNRRQSEYFGWFSELDKPEPTQRLWLKEEG